MGFESIFNFLKDIGLAKEYITPLIIISLVAFFIFSKKLDKALTPIKNAILEIQGIFTSYKFPLKYCLTETAGSPLNPTEYGMQLIKESGMERILKLRMNTFLRELNEKLKEIKDISDYDVQEQARNLMVSYENKPFIKPIKDYAFKSGISVEIILRTAGLILRDEYLKRYLKKN
jgi:hypothetical protein